MSIEEDMLGNSVWELRRLSFGNGVFARVFFGDFPQVGRTSWSLVLAGRALVCEVVFRTADHAEVVFAAAFALFWEELAIRAEDFRQVWGLGARGRGRSR